jgi:serine/threonine-protein kinase
VAFLTGERILKVVSLTGAPPETLVEVGLVRGGLSWADDGHLYFTSAGTEEALPGLRRVPATGGAVEVVTVVDTLRAEIRHFFPDVLPGSRLAVVTVAREVRYDPANREVAVLDLVSGETLARFAGTMGIWSPSGHVLIVGEDGVLKAAPFDVGRREAGQATSVFGGVQVEVQASVDIDLSDSGTLVYAPESTIGGLRFGLAWVDRTGESTAAAEGWSGVFTHPRLSPDGRLVAVALDNPGRQAQMWVRSLEDGRETLLTPPGTNNWSPSWLGDGSVVYAANGDGGAQLWSRRADAATAAELLLGPDVVSGWESAEVSADGEWMVFDAGSEIGARRLDGEGPQVSVARHPSLGGPALSPDGRWIAYTSQESGVEQVYVRPFPDVDSGRWQVSAEAARAPRWARDGRELFYLSGDSLMVARVTEGETISIEAGTPLFATEPYRIPGPVPPYDVHPDGQRFLMIERPKIDSDRIFVVEGFFQELESMEPGEGR